MPWKTRIVAQFLRAGAAAGGKFMVDGGGALQ